MIIDYETIEKSWGSERGDVLSGDESASQVEISMGSRTIPMIRIQFTGLSKVQDIYKAKKNIKHWLEKFGIVRVDDRGLPDAMGVTLEVI